MIERNIKQSVVADRSRWFPIGKIARQDECEVVHAITSCRPAGYGANLPPYF